MTDIIAKLVDNATPIRAASARYRFTTRTRASSIAAIAASSW